MADQDNAGQFGKRPDTQEQASKGGSTSGGNLKNDPQRASEMGKKSHSSQSEESDSDESMAM